MQEERFSIELFRESTGSVLRVPVPEEIDEVMRDDDADDDMIDFTMRQLVQWYKDEFMHDGWEAIKVHHGMVD